MESLLDSLLTWLIAQVPRVENQIISLMQPWRLFQIVLMVVCAVAGYLLAWWLRPKMTAWIRGMENASKSRLRALVLVQRRMGAIFFVILAWLSVGILRASTWPSRSYLIALIASLVSAWIFVAITTRMIRNRLLRTVVTWGAWAFVTINILGVREDTEILLDQIAFNIGSLHLSLLVLLKGAVALGILFASAGWLSRLIVRRIEASEDISPSMKVLADKFLRIFIYGMALVVGMQSVGFDMTNLTVLSGAIGLGLGFGLQKVISNLVSGVILLLDKSIKPGDVISLGETFGWIASLGARYVSVVTRDGREYLIPNEDLITGQVVNWSYSSDLVRLDIHFGVSYDSDPHQIRKIAVAAVQRVPRVVSNRAPVCHVTGFGDSSIDFIVRFWIRDPVEGLTNIRGAVFLALWDTLKENNIEIPFPRRDITILPASAPIVDPQSGLVPD